ncbi:MAG: polyamine aminopropyltransferase [Polyangiaceae bacterium]
MIPRRHISPVLLASVVVIATSGLVYELIAGTVASYVLGDSVAQFSFVIGLYLFAMGLGSYLSKFLETRLLERFVEIELAVALVGGASAPILFAVYAAQGAFRVALYSLVIIVGTLVGLEIPLLIRLLEFRLKLKDLVARVLALDYVGALVASLLFPLVLLPKIGLHKTSLVVGMLNAVVAFIATFLMPIDRGTRFRLRAECVVITAALGFGMVYMDQGLLRAETLYFGAPVIYAHQSPYQRIVITQSPRTTRLFLNGNLQFSSDDEQRYHEVLVHPAVSALGRAPRRVLILGGGDGLAARELLKYPELESIHMVDLDPAMTKVFREVPVARALNEGSLDDPRVTVENADAFAWLETAKESFDLAVVDFPDPSNYALGKLYTKTFYERLRERIGTRGVVVVQATSPYYGRQSFWCIAETMEAAGFHLVPMHLYVPSFGEWGFLVGGAEGITPPRQLLVAPEKLRFLEPATFPLLYDFPRDMDRVEAPVNRLNDQQLVGIYTREWAEWSK